MQTSRVARAKVLEKERPNERSAIGATAVEKASVSRAEKADTTAKAARAAVAVTTCDSQKN